uniref:Uncharacterized protein n=1 Tax=Arundo donax TaxID=35708 RepID=A0A0A9C3E5_ARUDO
MENMHCYPYYCSVQPCPYTMLVFAFNLCFFNMLANFLGGLNASC